jgi:DNA-directed RNA polymerase II subunit RPB11
LKKRPIPVSALQQASADANCTSGTASTAIFTFNKEDHTLGNLLRDRLLQNSHVTFSGYKVCTNCPPGGDMTLTIKVPHPLFAKFELRIQTYGQITPKEALTAACQELIRELNKLKTNFQDAYNLTKMVQGGPNGA